MALVLVGGVALADAPAGKKLLARLASGLTLQGPFIVPTAVNLNVDPASPPWASRLPI